jgi:hypothetical protein
LKYLLKLKINNETTRSWHDSLGSNNEQLPVFKFFLIGPLIIVFIKVLVSHNKTDSHFGFQFGILSGDIFINHGFLVSCVQNLENLNGIQCTKAISNTKNV